jgi:hypothetical protein
MTAKPGLTRTSHGDVLMPHRYALTMLNLIELFADILRHGGAGLHRHIADRYTSATVDLLLIELDLHAQRLRRVTTTTTTKEPR